MVSHRQHRLAVVRVGTLAVSLILWALASVGLRSHSHAQVIRSACALWPVVLFTVRLVSSLLGSILRQRSMVALTRQYSRATCGWGHVEYGWQCAAQNAEFDFGFSAAVLNRLAAGGGRARGGLLTRRARRRARAALQVLAARALQRIAERCCWV